MQFLDPTNDLAFKKIFGNIARTMLAERMPVEAVSKCTGLSITEIKILLTEWITSSTIEK